MKVSVWGVLSLRLQLDSQWKSQVGKKVYKSEALKGGLG